MKYTQQQIDIAFGIMSGRIEPEHDLHYYDDAKKLYTFDELEKYHGLNPGAHAHRLKAEEILKHLILKGNQP